MHAPAIHAPRSPAPGIGWPCFHTSVSPGYECWAPAHPAKYQPHARGRPTILDTTPARLGTAQTTPSGTASAANKTAPVMLATAHIRSHSKVSKQLIIKLGTGGRCT
mmetsp:Transcript_106531/g.183678  ORF Transcript_106531/g.183678 Transcript_106531/m.183678 type:complete len:107 (-) Transcript_106531:8-328(-)